MWVLLAIALVSPSPIKVLAEPVGYFKTMRECRQVMNAVKQTKRPVAYRLECVRAP